MALRRQLVVTDPDDPDDMPVTYEIVDGELFIDGTDERGLSVTPGTMRVINALHAVYLDGE